MRKLALLSIPFFVLLNAKPNPSELFSKIKESKHSLVSTQKEKSVTHKQLQVIANKIKQLKDEIEKYDKKIYELNGILGNANKKYQDAMAEIKGIDNIVKSLDKDIEKKTKEFAQKVSMQLGGVVAQNKTAQKDEKSVVLKEVLDRYKNYNQQELLKLSRNIEQKNALRKNLLKRRDDIAKSIKDVNAQKKLYEKEKAQKSKLLKKLALEEKLYSKRLREIFRRQTVIRLTLTKLNLIQEETAKEAKRREIELKKRIRALRHSRHSNTTKVAVVDGVKQYGTSYSLDNIYKYRGVKTIAPLKSAKLIKNFGTFIDPIYKIKSHSDSVTLISKSSDRRVYNVMNGEVSYIGENSMLGKLVVIKHSNGMHTIYADLNKFSPFLKVGAKVKKGSIIGKVKRKLIFEATKNGKFINPTRLINL